MHLHFSVSPVVKILALVYTDSSLYLEGFPPFHEEKDR